MEQFRFKKWDVYKDSRDFFSFALKLVRKVPRDFRFEIGSQLIRSAFSISLNIAEGSGKSSDKEMNRFFEIALGSVYESLAAIDILEYNGFISSKERNEAEVALVTISKQLGGFKKKLN